MVGGGDRQKLPCLSIIGENSQHPGNPQLCSRWESWIWQAPVTPSSLEGNGELR